MKHICEENNLNRTVSYLWKKNKIWHSFTVKATLNSSEIKSYSETEFITEHYWGYAKVTDSKTNEYEVTHPKWKQYLGIASI